MMLRRLAEWIVRHAKWLVIVTLVLGAVAGIYGAGVVKALSPGGFEVAGGESQRVTQVVEDRFGQGGADVIALIDDPVGDVATSDATREALAAMVARVIAMPSVASVESPLGPHGDSLVSADRRTGMVVVSLRGDAAEKEAAFPEVAAALRGEDTGALVRIGGPIAVAEVGQQTAEHDLRRAELVAFPLVALLLLFFFGGRVAAVLPLVVGGLAIAFATASLRALAQVGDISVFALNIVTLLGLGLAIDYSLFVVQRFREELAFAEVGEAVVRTIASAGKTMLFSGVAVAVSLLALLVFPIALLHSIAIAGALIVVLTVLAALVFLPALLVLLGRRIKWPRRRDASAVAAPQGRRWAAVANWVMRRPGVMALGTAALLVVVGWPALRLHTEISDARIFPREFEVRQVQERIEAADGFAAAGTVQYMLVLEGEQPMWQAEALDRLWRTHEALAAVPQVRRVDDFVGGLGQDSRERFVAAATGLAQAPELPAALAGVIDGNATLVRVTAAAPGNEHERATQVAALREAAAPAFAVSIGGMPKVAQEVDEALRAGAVPAAAIVVSVTLVVLTLAFGAIVVAVKAVIMNVLSLMASFGALVWIFQDGRLQGLLGYHATGSIDPLILLVMFAIVFGLSMDYELFLLSRIREDYGESGDAKQSVARGLAATGRLITMAGAMLIVVLLGFGTANILFVKELGIGMAIAVAIDATIVRGLLVPSTMRLLGRWNWWSAAWFDRWWKRWDIGVRELPAGTEARHEPAR